MDTNNHEPEQPANNGKRSATMRTIAEKLNISVATVSRALTRIPTTSSKTRALVLQTAAEVGYSLPKAYRARYLKRDQALQNVGVLIETAQTHIPAPYLTGLSEAAMNLNASLIIHYTKPENAAQILDPKLQPPAMRAGQLSGVIFVFRWPAKVVREISRTMPVVSITHEYPGVEHDLIGIDNHRGVEMLVKHLYELGHRKIGFLGACSEVHWANIRYASYVAALKGIGIEYRPEWIVDTSLQALLDPQVSCDPFNAQVGDLIEQGVRAWICVSEPVGQQLYAWLTAHQVRVPQDVSITGFHRPDVVPANLPRLTSVTASYEAMGAAALKRLLYRIQNRAESMRTILFPCELYVGESTGPVPSGDKQSS